MGLKNFEEYFDYLKDKRVIIVGPAGYMENSYRGEMIDKYDVIVRMNLASPVPPERYKDIGSRTDVLYHLVLRTHQVKSRPDLFHFHTIVFP